MANSSIRLSPSYVRLVRAADVDPESLDECNRLLQKNYEEYRIFFRDTAGHNHIVHSLLTALALGASLQQLRDRYEDGVPI